MLNFYRDHGAIAYSLFVILFVVLWLAILLNGALLVDYLLRSSKGRAVVRKIATLLRRRQPYQVVRGSGTVPPPPLGST
jgi:hypothetical protein